ncbi:hypothetical protein D3C73_833500 [compost metagenome]
MFALRAAIDIGCGKDGEFSLTMQHQAEVLVGDDGFALLGQCNQGRINDLGQRRVQPEKAPIESGPGRIVPIDDRFFVSLCRNVDACHGGNNRLLPPKPQFCSESRQRLAQFEHQCPQLQASCAGNWQVGGSLRDHRRGNRDGRRRNTLFAPARSLECRGQNITAVARRNQLSAVAQIFRSHLIDVGTNAADANAFISSPIHPRVINPVQAVDRGAVTQHRATGGIFFRHA